MTLTTYILSYVCENIQFYTQTHLSGGYPSWVRTASRYEYWSDMNVSGLIQTDLSPQAAWSHVRPLTQNASDHWSFECKGGEGGGILISYKLFLRLKVGKNIDFMTGSHTYHCNRSRAQVHTNTTNMPA